MFYMNFNKHIKLIEEIFPAAKGAKKYTHSGQGLPLWINKSVKIVLLMIQADQEIALVFPVCRLEFDQLANIQRQVKKHINALFIIVADKQNPKYRSLLCREGIRSCT